jgi:diketogulonate reductase-like aldo/keto reductase
MIPSVALSNGVKIPLLGLGMDQVRDAIQARDSVAAALAMGYRSIDTASSYGNERPVGEAIGESGVPRGEIFVTTKVTADDQGYDSTLRAFDHSLELLGLTYLDSYLIHWPGRYLYPETWRAMERLYREGRIRAIGVCNFLPYQLQRLQESAEISPMIDQLEWHPYFQQRKTGAYCRDRGILVEAWSPLMCGGIVLQDEVVAAIARRAGKSPAQVVLRWHIQGGRRVFPKSVTPARIRENMEVFDFELSSDELAWLDSLGERAWRIGPDPAVFFTN